MAYECRFLGAAEDIGRLGFIAETSGNRFLFDYGIAPDKPPLYPLESPSMDQVFLTHAHLDHSGMIPWLASRFDATIMTTQPTAEVSTLMHRDSLKIARMEGFPEPYADDDIVSTQSMYDFVRFGDRRQVGNVEARFHSAGHIPGAMQVELRGDDGTMVFTGDLFTRPQRLVMGAEPVPCDVLCMETTYAGREHPDRSEVEKEFLDYCDTITGRGGKVIAPAFAVGRSQELAMVLAGQGYNVWMDGMARKVAQIYRSHPSFLQDAAAYERAISDVSYVHSHRQRAVALKQADVILTTSGMLDGGPVLYYLDRLRNDRRCGIALTGYQVRGTNGRMLMDEGRIDLDPRDPGRRVHPINCQVEHFDFSAHAGHKDLVDFARGTGAKDIVLFHGDNREELVPDLSDFATCHLPNRGDGFTIA